MKYFITIFSLFFVLNSQSQAATTQDSNATYKTITLRSTGEVETLPDMASFNINLSCLDKSIENAKNCLVDKSNDLMKTLRSFGVDKDDILTTSVNLVKSYTWEKNTRVFEGFKSSTSVFVTIKNLNKLDAIYTALLSNENLDLSGLSFSHSKLDDLKNDAYVDALNKANILADRLIENLPESEKEILKIGNVEISASLPENQSKMAVESDRAALMSNNTPVAISKGTVKVQATLYVVYQMK